MRRPEDPVSKKTSSAGASPIWTGIEKRLDPLVEVCVTFMGIESGPPLQLPGETPSPIDAGQVGIAPSPGPSTRESADASGIGTSVEASPPPLPCSGEPPPPEQPEAPPS